MTLTNQFGEGKRANTGRRQNPSKTTFTDEHSTEPGVKSRNISRYTELQGKSSATESAEEDSNSGATERNITLDMMKRKAVIQDVCSKAGSGYSSGKEVDMLVNEEKQILFCSIPKAGCTNVARVFLGLSGIVNISQLANVSGRDVHSRYPRPTLRSFSKEKREFALKTYTKAILVRDPMERLLSAFNNKFFLPDPKARNVYAKLVLRFYDNHPTLRTNRTIYNVLRTDPLSVTFSEFIQYMVDCIDNNVSISNAHFMKYWRLCDPCNVKYDYIGKYETLDEDIAYIFDKMSIDVGFPKKMGLYSAIPTRLLVDAAYAKVQRYNIQKIYDLYKADYMLFGYPLPNVLK